jgi:hypothetical protein
VPQGKLLGFIVSHRGIKANPEKINTITAMDAPKTIKDVQKLTGCMTALNRFISQLGERGLPFFKLLKLHDKFKWTKEANQALQDLKHHLQSPPILTATLHRRNYSRCQYGNRGGTTGRRPRLHGAMSSLLHR